MLMPRRSIAWPVSRNMKPAFRRSCITMAVAMAKRPLCSVDVHTQPGPPMSLPIRSDGDSTTQQNSPGATLQAPSPSQVFRSGSHQRRWSAADGEGGRLCAGGRARGRGASGRAPAEGPAAGGRAGHVPSGRPAGPAAALCWPLLQLQPGTLFKAKLELPPRPPRDRLALSERSQRDAPAVAAAARRQRAGARPQRQLWR
jgi:hypothetical protein